MIQKIRAWCLVNEQGIVTNICENGEEIWDCASWNKKLTASIAYQHELAVDEILRVVPCEIRVSLPRAKKV